MLSSLPVISFSGHQSRDTTGRNEIWGCLESYASLILHFSFSIPKHNCEIRYQGTPLKTDAYAN